MSSKKYSPIIYCYDIETSSLTYGEEHLQSTYLHGLASFKYKTIPHAPFSDFEDEMTYESFRTYKGISDKFFQLNEYAANHDLSIKIFVHNLSYEFEAMMRNIEFCIKNFSIKNFIAVAPHQPLLATFDRLEFYDSFKILSCKSLETIGNELGVPKLKEVKGGYNQKYYWWSKLPDSEYVYNKRDCQLVLYALCRYMANFTAVNSVADISVSNTSMIKRETRVNRSIASHAEIAKAQREAFHELNNEQFIKLMQDTLAGGYTHANPYAVGKHYINVWCFDASSMHPSAMYGRMFPYGWRSVDNEYFSKFARANFNYLSGQLSGCSKADNSESPVSSTAPVLSGFQNAEYDCILKAAYSESLKFERPILNYFMARVTFTNIKARDFGTCIYGYISASKCTDIKKAGFDNGKVTKAEELTFVGCDIDYLLIDMLYTYDSADCKEIITATKRKRMSQPLRNTVKYYARQKTGYKKLEKKVADHIESLSDFTFEGLELYQENVANEIMNTHNKDLVHFALMASKGGLNGQYGCSAMKPLRAEVGVVGGGQDFDWIDAGEIFLKSKNSLNIFTDGLYTVAYSRLHLICFMLYLVLAHNITPLYHDTDSGYFVGYNDEVQKSIDQFNANILANSVNTECYNFGIMDFDGYYEDFCTWGSKCYCATYKDPDGNLKVKATVAGASKKELSKLFTEIVNDTDFDYLIEEYFRPDISYDETINKKLIRKTPGTRIVGDYTDENGESGHIDECSVTVLEPCGYTLRSTTSAVNLMYYQYCYKLQGRTFNRQLPEIVTIEDNDFGKYKKKYSEKTYDFYCEGNPASMFQLQHKRGDTKLVQF